MLQLTPQRQAVLDVLRSAGDHPTAAEVLERVREVSPGIGAATVYRALTQLVEAGAARELALDGAPAARFDANTARHDHLVCSRCGAAEDVVVPLPADVVTEVAGATGFAVASYDLVLHGLCPTCQAASAQSAGDSTASTTHPEKETHA